MLIYGKLNYQKKKQSKKKTIIKKRIINLQKNKKEEPEGLEKEIKVIGGKIIKKQPIEEEKKPAEEIVTQKIGVIGIEKEEPKEEGQTRKVLRGKVIIKKEPEEEVKKP